MHKNQKHNLLMFNIGNVILCNKYELKIYTCEFLSNKVRKTFLITRTLRYSKIIMLELSDIPNHFSDLKTRRIGSYIDVLLKLLLMFEPFSRNICKKILSIKYFLFPTLFDNSRFFSCSIFVCIIA